MSLSHLEAAGALSITVLSSRPNNPIFKPAGNLVGLGLANDHSPQYLILINHD
jgi:hypothetical protein